jgi:hypothetical protein
LLKARNSASGSLLSGCATCWNLHKNWIAAVGEKGAVREGGLHEPLGERNLRRRTRSVRT